MTLNKSDGIKIADLLAIEIQGMSDKSPSFRSIKTPEKINTLRVVGNNRNTLIVSKPKDSGNKQPYEL